MKNRTYKHGVYFKDDTGECVFECGGNAKLGHAGDCDALTLVESYDKQTEWVKLYRYHLCRIILAANGELGNIDSHQNFELVLDTEVQKALALLGPIEWVRMLVQEYEKT